MAGYELGDAKQLKDSLEEWSSSKYAVSEEGINFQEMLARDLDTIYFCNNIDEGLEMVDPSNYWNLENYTITSSDHVYFESKRSFPYGKASAYMKLAPDDATIFYGLEQGSASPQGHASFKFEPPDTYKAQVLSVRGASRIMQLDISDSVPADAQDTNYVYDIEKTENAVWFYIQKELVGVILHGLETDIVSKTGIVADHYGPDPYWVAGTNVRLPKSSPHFLEFDPSDEDTWEIERQIVEPGIPMYSKSLRLYDFEADTLLTEGTYDTGTSYKSHPIPVYGFDSKSLYFQADTASVTDGLTVETLTQEGNWRTYETRTLSANSLEVINLAGEMPLVRIGYEPSANGASITDAEATLT